MQNHPAFRFSTLSLQKSLSTVSTLSTGRFFKICCKLENKERIFAVGASATPIFSRDRDVWRKATTRLVETV